MNRRIGRAVRLDVACWLVGALALASPAAAATAGPTPAIDAAADLLADATLVDAECPSVAVDFGIALRAVEALDVQPSAFMPAGSLRGRFEAAYGQRFAGTSHDDLCGPVVDDEDRRFPGLFHRR